MAKYEEFITLAKKDLEAAKIILNSSNDELMQNIAAYHTQQAVEKIMKGLIVQAGHQAGITHSITELSKDLDDIGVSYPTWISEVDYDISSWATTIRYNTNYKADHDLVETVIKDSEEWIAGL